MRFRFALLLVPAAVLLSAMGACSNQGEGRVCDFRAPNNGNDDCQSPLVCTQNIPGVNGSRCCPVDRSTSTVPECAGTPSLADANPAPPDGTTTVPDASSDGAPPSDGAAVPDAPGEAMSSDAEAGAAGEAGPQDASGQ
jgi:hypothetical protein